MLKVGAHTSISGGIVKSFSRSENIGANALQIFAKSPRGWFMGYPKLSEEDVQKSRESFVDSGQEWGVIHSVYLVNLAKEYEEAGKDRESLMDDFLVAEKLGFWGVNVHMGKFGKGSKEKALRNMKENIKYILEQNKDTPVYFVLENTAGQGSEIGYSIQEMGMLYELLHKEISSELIERKVRFCFDTSHGWGAGYDINDWEGIVYQFEKFVGADKLLFLHLNDSMAPLGSYLDRHANLGKGFIGMKGFRGVIKRAVENDKPLILETPDDSLRADETQKIRELSESSTFPERVDEFHRENYKTQVLKKYQN